MVEAAEGEVSADGPVNASTVGEEVLQHFWDLASLDEPVRLRAAVALVGGLEASQKAYGGSKKPRKEPAKQSASKQAQVDALLHDCSPLVIYAVRRLVKGLASGRQAARQGFALALTLVLTKLQAVPTDAVLGLMDIWLQTTNSMKGSDARDALLGRPFGYAAVVRSGRLQQDPPLVKRMAALLLESMQSKSFLGEASAAALAELLEGASDADFLAAVKEVEGLEAVVQVPAESATPEDLLLAIRLWGRLPAETLAGCSLLPQGVQPPAAHFFSSRDRDSMEHPLDAAVAFFSENHLRRVLDPLRLSSASHPRLHLLWQSIFTLLVPGFPVSKRTANGAVDTIRPLSAQLEAFWKVVVEEDLFTSTPERKFLGFEIFTALLPHFGPEQVPLVFSRQFQRSFVDSLSQQTHHLHAAAKRATERMRVIAAESSDPALGVAITVALQRQGGVGFDRLSRTNAVSQMMQAMDSNSVQLYVKHLKSAFAANDMSEMRQSAGGGEDSEDEDSGKNPAAGLEFGRRWVIEQLAGACALPHVSPKALEAAVKFLALHAFFELDASKVQDKELKAAARVEPAPSVALRKLCAARLVNVLEKAGKAKVHQKAPSDTSGDGKDNNRVEVHERRTENALLKAAISFLDKTEAAEGARLAVELSEPIAVAVETLRKLETRAAKALAKSNEELSAIGSRADQLLAVLQLVRWLHLYVIGDAENVDADIADELSGIFKAAFGKAGNEKNGNAIAPSWMDQLTDICLSLLAYSSAELPSSALREAVEAVFRAFAAQLTPTGMQDLIRVLSRPDQPAKGDDDDDVLAPEDDSEEDDSGDEEDSADGSDSEEEDGEEAADDAEAESMEIEIGGTANKDLGDEDMSDEQMFKMDKMIAAILRSNKDEKNSAKRTQQALQNFKLRTLALLEIFSKAAPGSPLLAAHLAQLIQAAEAAEKSARLKQVAERFRTVICRMCRCRPSKADAQSIPPEILREAIIKVHLSRGRAAPGDANLKKASEAALQYLFSAAAIAGTDGHKAAAAEGVKAVLSSFLKRRNLRIPRTLIESFARQNQDLAAALLSDLSSFSSAVRTSLYPEAVGMLDTILSRASQAQAKDMGPAAVEAAPKLAASCAVVLKGAGFERAKKHGETLKTLADAVERLTKLLPQPLSQHLPEAALKALQDACSEAHSTAVTPKVAQAAAKIGSLVGITLGAFTPEGPKRAYRRADAPAARLSGVEEPSGKPTEEKAQIAGLDSGGTKKPGKKRKSWEAGGKLALEVGAEAPGVEQSKHQRKGAETVKQAVGSVRAEPAPLRKSVGKEGSKIESQKAVLAQRNKGKSKTRT